jgi:WD40 repeat protein
MAVSIYLQRVFIWVLMFGVLAVGFAAPAQETEPSRQAKDKPPVRTDRYGDPLPPGAIARLGTIRLRPGNGVYLLACLPDQKTFLSAASEDDRMLVSVWRRTTGELFRRFEVPLDVVRGVDLAPDGKTLAASGYYRADGMYHVLFWDVASGKKVGELTGTGGNIFALAFAPNGKILATAGADQNVRLWDVAGRSELRRCQGAKDIWGRLAFSADSKILAASNTHQRAVRLWDVATGRELRTIRSDTPRMHALVFSPDGKTLATAGSNDKTIRLWEVATGKEVRQFQAPWAASVLAFSPDGKTLASGGERVEGKILEPSPIQLWDVNTGRELRRLRGHLFGVSTLAFSSDGKQLLSGGSGNVLHVWDVATGKDVLPFAEHESYVWSVVFSPDGRFLATGGLDGTIRLWEPRTGKAARVFEKGHPQRVWSVAFTPDGRTLVSYGHDGSIRFWDVAEGRQKRQWQDSEDRTPSSFALSPDGRTLALLQKNSPIRLLDAATGKEQQRLTVSTGNGGMLQFAPDGTKLASLSVSGVDDSGVLQLWDVATGKELHMWKVAQAGRIAFSADGQTLFSVTGGFSPSRMGQRTFHAWNMTTGENRPFQAIQQARVFAVAGSPNGRMLAWGDAEGTITLWELAAGQVRRRMKGHHSYVESLAFSPDGKALASGSADTTALLWDVTGMPFERRGLPLDDERLQSLWKDLAGKDAGKAFDAIGLLTAAPEQAVPLLKNKLRPAPEPAERRHVAQLIADLDSEDFAVREKAMEQLRQLGERAEPGLREALKNKPALEARKRIEELLEGVRAAAVSPDNLRHLRAVEVLEHIGTPEAREVLKKAADGAAAARLTREAKASLERLNRRHDFKP